MGDSAVFKQIRISKAFVVSVGMSLVSFPSWAGDTSSFTYDALGRLVQVSRTSTTANSTTSVYAFDPASNRTNVSVIGAADSDPSKGQAATAPCAGGAICRYFMAPIAGFAPIQY